MSERGSGWVKRSGIRAPLIVAAAIAAIVVAVAGWLALAPSKPPAPAPHATAPATPAKPVAKKPPPATPVPVSSVPADKTYPLADWSAATVPSGFVDGVELDGAPLDPAKAKLLVAEDVLTVSGWAGDRALGIRFPNVVLSLCGRVVATTGVDQPRPDVAKAVHPNLGHSGWTARLLVGHLPRCANATLQGWGVAPFGQVLFPLQGGMPLALAPAEPLDPQIPIETHPLLHPGDLPKAPQEVRVTVKGAVHVRSCGSVKCPVVGELKQGGQHVAALLDQAEGWALVVVPKAATGWLAERVVKIAKSAK